MTRILQGVCPLTGQHRTKVWTVPHSSLDGFSPPSFLMVPFRKPPLDFQLSFKTMWFRKGGGHVWRGGERVGVGGRMRDVN